MTVVLGAVAYGRTELKPAAFEVPSGRGAAGRNSVRMLVTPAPGKPPDWPVEVPPRLPVGRRSEHFEDPLGPTQRQAQVIVIGRHSAAAAVVGDGVGHLRRQSAASQNRSRIHRSAVWRRAERACRSARRPPPTSPRARRQRPARAVVARHQISTHLKTGFRSSAIGYPRM
jgi:hypothetical protein